MKYQTISLLLILTNLSPSRPTNLDDPNSPHCTIVQPSDLDVLYANDAEVVLELRRGPSARGGRAVAKALRVSVRVDGAAAGDSPCPARLTLRGLQAGMHVLSLAPAAADSPHRARRAAAASTTTTTANRTFFVAHDMFRPGRPWSPPSPPGPADLDGSGAAGDERCAGDAGRTSPRPASESASSPC